MKQIGLILLSLIVFVVIKDTYFYKDKGLPINYVCSCSGSVVLLCENKQLNVILENDHMMIGDSKYDYSSKGRPASFINDRSDDWSTVNKSIDQFFEFHLYPSQHKATYENEFGKEELACQIKTNT